MTILAEIAARMVPIIGAGLDAFEKQRELFPIKYLIKDMQMAAYWLHSAKVDLDPTDSDDITTKIDGTHVKAEPMPTLLSVPDNLDFIKTNLKTLYADINIYLDTQILPPQVIYKIQRCSDKLMEASFNNDLATNYYGQITRYYTNARPTGTEGGN